MLRSFFTDSSSHGGEEFWAYGWPSPWTLGDADTAGSSFSEVGDAFIEIHVPTLHAAHYLLLWGNRAGRAGLCTHLTRRAEFVGTEVDGPGWNQRHIGSDTCQPNACAKTWAD